MREILFRAKTVPDCKDIVTGKTIKTPKWIHGYVDLGYMHDCGVPIISDEKGNKAYKCQYESIGQFTGLTDKNGKKIFEGDIVKYGTNTNRADNKDIHEVVFETRGGCGYFGIKISDIETWQFCLEVPAKLMEVIGNIHDNPELLEVKK